MIVDRSQLFSHRLLVDTAAFFFGKMLGRHKLSSLSLLAGYASPNKTVEGLLAGVLCCTSVCMWMARQLHWPHWQQKGMLYGSTLALLGVLGDLTTSLIKRDAKVKDSGSLLPGYGGLIDRLDSYLFTAPYAFFFLKCVLPN